MIFIKILYPDRMINDLKEESKRKIAKYLNVGFLKILACFMYSIIMIRMI